MYVCGMSGMMIMVTEYDAEVIEIPITACWAGRVVAY